MWKKYNTHLKQFCTVLINKSIISSGFKETAFLLAVSSAALSHALAKACSSGRMERCTCDDSPGLQHREAWQWGVCGDNLKYSTKFLKKFLGQKRVSKDLRAQIDAHNINVGVRVRCKIFSCYMVQKTWSKNNLVFFILFDSDIMKEGLSIDSKARIREHL